MMKPYRSLICVPRIRFLICVCGSHIEAGESIVMAHGRAVHVGCQQNAGLQADRQMNLWRSDFLFDETQTEALEHAEVEIGADHISFDGETVLALDIPRLTGQIEKVYGLMKDGEFRTLSQIARACGCLETSVGARLRDLRKERFGSHTVESRQVKGTTLLYEYRLILNDGSATQNPERRQAAA